MTWNKSGEKQVETKGQDEKCAFTLVPSISASGELLPFQAVFHGKTPLSCPSRDAPGMDEADKLGFKFVFSGNMSYWSTQETMKKLVNEIIAPYFDRKKKELGLPKMQNSLWKIDCWSVHKSAEFRDWMKKNHENIILLFIPGGCTGVWQPLDVGIQQVLKLSLRRSAHRNIVAEVTTHLEGANSEELIALDVKLGTLRNRSVAWLVRAYQEPDDPDLIKKAFEMCRIGDFNCSHASITSNEALALLRNLPITHPAIHEELTYQQEPVLGEEEPAFADGMNEELATDDLDVPIEVLIDHLVSDGMSLEHGYAVDEEGCIVRNNLAEHIVAADKEEGAVTVPVLLGQGHQVRTKRMPWGGSKMWDT
ncbi:hypothetical protein AX17_005130 [Amanita inopinata Kibby_2008]|nr:hypothetical protein AX17_005130 [Amanita inopinata Kibby_2008]